MADEPAPSSVPSPAALARLLRQHLASLEAAGVEWLPAATAPLPALPTPIAAAPASSPEPADPLAERRVALRLLAERVAVCERCPALASSRTQTVFGVGRLDPDVCLVGEAPGADEDAQGEPFVGAAGQLLTRILAACGLRREDVYIANILKCRPPGNRTPEAQEADNCREHLLAQLDLVRPRFLLALGGTAIKGLLNTSASISRLRGKVHSFEGIPVVVTYHPAFLLPHRCPDDKTLRERKKMVWDDMKFLMTQLGRPVR